MKRLRFIALLALAGCVGSNREGSPSQGQALGLAAPAAFAGEWLGVMEQTGQPFAWTRRLIVDGSAVGMHSVAAKFGSSPIAETDALQCVYRLTVEKADPQGNSMAGVASLAKTIQGAARSGLMCIPEFRFAAKAAGTRIEFLDDYGRGSGGLSVLHRQK